MIKSLLRSMRFVPERPTPPLEDRLDSSDDVCPNPVLDVTDVTFERLVLQNEKLVVVDFWADWCQPCTIMDAYMNFLAAEFVGQLVVTALDVDENPLVPEAYQVMGMPTVIFFEDGEEVDRVMGIVAYEELKAQCQQILGADGADGSVDSSMN